MPEQLIDRAMDEVIATIRLRTAFSLMASRKIGSAEAKELAYRQILEAARRVADEAENRL